MKTLKFMDEPPPEPVGKEICENCKTETDCSWIHLGGNVDKDESYYELLCSKCEDYLYQAWEI